MSARALTLQRERRRLAKAGLAGDQLKAAMNDKFGGTVGRPAVLPSHDGSEVSAEAARAADRTRVHVCVPESAIEAAGNRRPSLHMAPVPKVAQRPSEGRTGAWESWDGFLFRTRQDAVSIAEAMAEALRVWS
jgi:hypothetical protein